MKTKGDNYRGSKKSMKTGGIKAKGKNSVNDLVVHPR